MNRRILSVTISVLGLIAIVLAVCSATIWKPSSTAQATLASSPDLNYVLTEPGVLGLVDSDVTITVTAASPDQPVVLAVARSTDAKAWLATDPYVSVTGLTDWTTLKSTDVTTICSEDAQPEAAEAAAEAATDGATEAATGAATEETGEGACTTLESSGADPAASDLWLATQTGTGSATLDLDATDPDLVVLAATNGAEPAPQIALSWPRSVATPWLVPGIVTGGVLLLIGIFLFLIDIQARHADEQRRARAAERAARLAQADSVSTAGIPQVADPNRPLSRREKREQERAQATGKEWIDPRTGRVYRGGVEVPVVPPAPEAEMMAADLDPAAVGPARGSAVVPGLDADATAAYRAGRGTEFETPYAAADPTRDAGATSGFGPSSTAADATWDAGATSDFGPAGTAADATWDAGATSDFGPAGTAAGTGAGTQFMAPITEGAPEPLAQGPHPAPPHAPMPYQGMPYQDMPSTEQAPDTDPSDQEHA